MVLITIAPSTFVNIENIHTENAKQLYLLFSTSPYIVPYHSLSKRVVSGHCVVNYVLIGSGVSIYRANCLMKYLCSFEK